MAFRQGVKLALNHSALEGFSTVRTSVMLAFLAAFWLSGTALAALVGPQNTDGLNLTDLFDSTDIAISATELAVTAISGTPVDSASNGSLGLMPLPTGSAISVFTGFTLDAFDSPTGPSGLN
jgi:hypothetical protein